MNAKNKKMLLLEDLSGVYSSLVEVQAAIEKLSNYPTATILLLKELIKIQNEINQYLKELKPYGIEDIEDAIFTLVEIKSKERLKQ